MVTNIAIGVGGLGSTPGSFKSDTVSPMTCHCCNLRSAELRWPSSKPRR